LLDPVWYVRGTAAWVLGQIGPGAREQYGNLVSCLSDNELEVRIAAVKTLGKIGWSSDTEIRDILVEVSRDHNQPPEVKEEAEEALQGMDNSMENMK